MFLPYVQSHVKATSDVVEVFDSTSRYLDEMLNINHPIDTKQKIYIDNPYFAQMLSQMLVVDWAHRS